MAWDPNITGGGGGGGMSIGGAITGANPWEVLYPDASGDLSQDAGFFRNLSTGETVINTTGAIFGSNIQQYQNADGTVNIVGSPAPAEFNGNTIELPDGSSSKFYNAVFDVSAFASQPPGTISILGQTRELADEDGVVASEAIYDLPAVFGGGISYDLSVEDTVAGTGGGFSMRHGPQGSGEVYVEMAIRDSVDPNNNKSITLTENPTRGIEYRIDNVAQYRLPPVGGIAGDVLTLDSGGVDATWTASSGPFSIVNTTSIFSTGLTFTGVGSTATNSFFVGDYAGESATNANNSNFFGDEAGQSATAASFSNFLGNSAGKGATNASASNFLGDGAGQNATNATQSNFFGLNAGGGATDAPNSNFLGNSAGFNAINASNSNFIGSQTGSGATNANLSNFIGDFAGGNATFARLSNFIGNTAGGSADYASSSNFIGDLAGQGSRFAQFSNFIGRLAGQNSPFASNSIFIGRGAGINDTVNNLYHITYTVSMGSLSPASIGRTFRGNVTNTTGVLASYDGTNAYFFDLNGIFQVGEQITDQSDLMNILTVASIVNLQGTSILIGNETSTGGYRDSIALGEQATNTATNQFMLSQNITDMTVPYLGSGTVGMQRYIRVDENGKFNPVAVTSNFQAPTYGVSLVGVGSGNEETIISFQGGAGASSIDLETDINLAPVGTKVVVMDTQGASVTNNIIINSGTGNQIIGEGLIPAITLPINTDYRVVTLIRVNNTTWHVASKL